MGCSTAKNIIYVQDIATSHDVSSTKHYLFMVQKRTHCISNLQIALSPKLCSNLKLNTLKSHNAVHETKGDEETQNTVDETNGLHCYSYIADCVTLVI